MQGKHVQAEALFKEALAIQEKGLRPEHPDVARLLNNYAAPPSNRTLCRGVKDQSPRQGDPREVRMSEAILNDRLWLKADLQPPKIEVCFAPNNGHSETPAGLPLVTQAVWKLFFGDRDEILIHAVGHCRNNDLPRPVLRFTCCAEARGVRVFTQPGPKAEVK